MKSLVSTVVEWVICIVIAVVLTFLLKTFLIDIIKVDGHSMDSTLHNKDMLVVEKVSTLKKDFNHGEIIILDPGNGSDNIYIKRIIGLPGDTIEIKDGKVFLNEKLLNEPYLDSNTYTDNNMKLTLDNDHVFVLGDNRSVSEDSRYLGPIPLENIKGHALFRLLPLKSFGTVK